MANLKEIRTRINSVKSTRQLTSAMKMVAAANLRKAQDRIIQLRPYAEKLKQILEHLGGEVEEERKDAGSMPSSRKTESVLLVMITSNKGLCGAFNAQVIREATRMAAEEYALQQREGKLEYYCIGKKGFDALKNKPYKVFKKELEIFDQLGFETAAGIAEELMDLHKQARFDRIELVYNQFKNAAVQILTHEPYLPIQEYAGDATQAMFQEYLLEPSRAAIIEELIPKSLKTQLYKALLDSFVSEHGARMTAMHQATENATELARELTLTYNKARQAAITNEILEVVSGANALDQ